MGMTLVPNLPESGIQGLPKGAILRPLAGAQAVKGLPPGALLRPLRAGDAGMPPAPRAAAVPVPEMHEVTPIEALTGHYQELPAGPPHDLIRLPTQGKLPDGFSSIKRGVKELATHGQRTKGATDVLRGVGENMSALPLPVSGEAGPLIKGLALSIAGSAAAPHVAKALGANEQQQELAGAAAGVLPMAAGFAGSRGADFAPGAESAHLPIEAETGRPVLQGSDDPKELRDEAEAHAPVLKEKLGAAVEGVPGARVAAVREQKSLGRVEEKAAAGKPVETQPDHLAARITADTPEAKEQVAENLTNLGTVKRDDNYAKKGGPNDFRADTHQLVANPAPDAALKTAEVQIVTPEQHEAAEDTHDLYEKQRTAAANGDKATAFKLAQQLKDANNAAAKAAAARQAEPKYKFGSTQANLPEGSEAHTAIESTRGKIADEDLAGDGKDIGGNHVTVRYGIQGGDPDKLRAFLQKQSPFEATLGKTASFPRTKNSDGAAVIQAPVQSDDLHRINAEIESHADFAPSSFPDYKPHVTVAYVKPEAADKYTGMSDTEGKRFPVNSVAITDRDGNAEDVKLAGQPAGISNTKGGYGAQPEQPSSGAELTAAPKVGGLPAPRPPQRGARWDAGTPVLVHDGQSGYQAGAVAHFNHGDNGAPRRARVSLDGGGKLDGVKEDSLLRIAPVVSGKSTTGTAQESAIMQRTAKEGPKMVQQYVKENTHDGVLDIATDAAKNLFPEFREDPVNGEPDVHTAAGAVRNAVLDTVLSKPPNPQKPGVLIQTASPGSGKSTALAGTQSSKIGLNLEAILSNPAESRSIVQKIVDSGRNPIIKWTYVDDPGKTVDRMLWRALGRGDTPGIGRTVNLDYMARSYFNVPRVLQGLQKQFGDKVEVQAVDNSGRPGEAVQHPDPKALLERASRYTYNEIREAMHASYEALSRDPAFSTPRGKAILKAATAPRGE